MAVTMGKIIKALSSAEPRYKRAAKFGVEALPYLEMLIKKKDVNPLLAAKAAYMVSLIHDEKSVGILLLAAESDLVQVRVAAADGIRNLPFPSAEKVLDMLKNDRDAGVRRIALRSMERRRKTE